MKILHLDSGIFVEQSVSRKISRDIVQHLSQQQPTEVIYRDLIHEPIPHLTADSLLAERDPLSETLIAELQAADIVVIGAPMYNFTIPTQLKAWLDRVLKAGVTFAYSEQGPQGLLTGKTAYIASGRGGIFTSGDQMAWDHQETYLQQVLQFIGITDVHIIRAEGVSMGDEPRQQALHAAKAAIAAI